MSTSASVRVYGRVTMADRPRAEMLSTRRCRTENAYPLTGFYTKNNHCYQDRPGTNLEKTHLSAHKEMRFSLQGYACQTKNLVASYREQFSATPGTTAKDFPFGIVSLADGTSGDTRHTHTHTHTHKTNETQTRNQTECRLLFRFASQRSLFLLMKSDDASLTCYVRQSMILPRQAPDKQNRKKNSSQKREWRSME